MSTTTVKSDRKTYDEALRIVADYLCSKSNFSEGAYNTARLCLADSLGCAILALSFPACRKLLGPLVPGTVVPHGSHVPGTDYAMDPIRAAFNIGTMVRWLDFNDTWLAAEWGHPSDNLGALLAVTDHLSRSGDTSLTVRDLLTAMIQAHEIQGVLALQNSFNRLGLDHVLLVKIASAAVSMKLLGGSKEQICDALSQAWIDNGPLRTYRHAPNTGSRKSWAAGDATSRGLRLAYMTQKGEMGYPSALTAPQWGFYDVVTDGKPLVFERPLGCYVMENVLFKISYPAEFHAQTAVEAAVQLHPLIKDKLDTIDLIDIETHESALRIIDKGGPLHNPADRDHCLQYMVAIGLLKGSLRAVDYEEEAAADSRIDKLRAQMRLRENEQYTKDYLDPSKRSIANAITIKFKDGTSTERVEVQYPIGHRRRREEGIPLLYDKLRRNLATLYAHDKTDDLVGLFERGDEVDKMTVRSFSDLWKP